MDKDRQEVLKADYDKLEERIRGLANEYNQSNNKYPNRIFMTNYHYYILKSGTDLIMLEDSEKIHGMEIERLFTSGDKIYCGYVEQG